ncbi:MAG: hypothetical protein HYV42_05890 [Candidatus Magasanikbacteria bacterium]|nr:hypothetical protein [Candidatus Magasanikbacteria bacterium]
MTEPITGPKDLIKSIYYYAVAFFSIIVFVISLHGLVSALVRLTISPEVGKFGWIAPDFPLGPECAPPLSNTSTAAACEARRENFRREQGKGARGQNYVDVAADLALMMVTIPLFLFHYRGARRNGATNVN